PCSVSQRRRATYPALQLLLEFSLEVAGVQMLADALFEPLQRRNERFGHVATPEGAEASLGVWEFASDGIGKQALAVNCGGCHYLSFCAGHSPRSPSIQGVPRGL